MSFQLRLLTVAVATATSSLSISAYAAGLDRSGQDISGFLQDGTYADVTYAYVDANVSGQDKGNGQGVNVRQTGDITDKYGFFRYSVKADASDSISVGVLYDEPFGAKVTYTGDSNFTGAANGVEKGLIDRLANPERRAEIKQVAEDMKSKFQTYGYSSPEGKAYLKLNSIYNGTNTSLEAIESMVKNGKTPKEIADFVNPQLATKASFNQKQIERDVLPALLDPNVSNEVKADLQKQIAAIQDNGTRLANMIQAINSGVLATDNGKTNVDVNTKNITGLVGLKLGQNKNLQVYAGPALQHLEGEVHLRGNAYKGATGYNAQITPDTAVGWVAGVAYSKPEIALKAALTYRSQIEHNTFIYEELPLASVAKLSLNNSSSQPFKVTTPDSYNLDFQTGLSAKHQLLGTLKVRYVPWSDFTITPPLYNNVAKTQGAEHIVEYAKDQWSAELGLGKKMSDSLAVSGTVGYDSGAGNPTTTLGPIKGYYSVGLGAKYNITPAVAISAGAKYLKFGDATAQLPTGDKVADFKGNDGYIVGLKLSYQQK